MSFRFISNIRIRAKFNRININIHVCFDPDRFQEMLILCVPNGNVSNSDYRSERILLNNINFCFGLEPFPRDANILYNTPDVNISNLESCRIYLFIRTNESFSARGEKRADDEGSGK